MAVESTFAHVGWIYYEAHAATPLVLGDLDDVRAWRGTDDPSEELAHVKVGARTVVTHSMAMLAPDVFVARSGDTVVLLASRGHERSLLEEHSDDDVARFVAAPLVETFGAIDVSVPSGVLAIAVAYESQNELPKAAPKKPRCSAGRAIIPVSPGVYRLVDGRTSHGYKTVLTKVRRGASRR